ncbi:MAG: hypothetical protein ACTSU3_11025 [Candidatus Thorarchaeota archaeon]
MQLPFLPDSIWNLVIGGVISIGLLWAYYRWTVRLKLKLAVQLDIILMSKQSISILELSETLGRKPLDRKTVFGIIDNAESAILSFSKATVLSKSIIRTKLKEMLMNNSIIHTEKASNQWDIIPSQIASLVQSVCSSEGLDVLQTNHGDFLLVPDLKERLRDTISLHGKISARSESQRLQVESDEFVQLVESWGWSLIKGSDDSLISPRWLRSTLERSINKIGYLDTMNEARRLDLIADDIIRAVGTFDWNLVETTETYLVPGHIIEEKMAKAIEEAGYLDLVSFERDQKVSTSETTKLLRKRKDGLIISKDKLVMTLDYLKQRIKDDLELAGMLDPKRFAGDIGLDEGLIIRILQADQEFRKVQNGNYISLPFFRRWLLDDVMIDGLVTVKDVESKWGLSGISLTMLMKRFGLRVVQTKTGDYLSLAWVRRIIKEMIAAGKPVEAKALANRYNITVSTAESILSNIEVDALLDSEGVLVPIPIFQKELKEILEKKGLLDPQRIAKERGIDVSDIERVVKELHTNALVSTTGVIINLDSMLSTLRHALSKYGIFDLVVTAQKFRIDYAHLAKPIEGHLVSGEYLIDACGVVVSTTWIDLLREFAAEAGIIPVTEFATERRIRRSAVLCLMRRLLNGTYLSNSDSFFVHV